MKRISIILVSICFLFSLASCGDMRDGRVSSSKNGVITENGGNLTDNGVAGELIEKGKETARETVEDIDDTMDSAKEKTEKDVTNNTTNGNTAGKTSKTK